MKTHGLLTAVILAPLAGATLIGLFGRRMNKFMIDVIACGAVFVSMISAFTVFFLNLHAIESGEKLFEPLFTWIQVGSFRTDFSLLLDSLSGIYIVFVTFVAFWIHVFATGYMKGEDGYWRFFAYLNLFMFAMLTLILADNFLLMFVGWEGVGLCSYLLIGFYFTKNFANDAAKKAFIVNRIGDFGFALGVLLLFWKSGSIFYFTDSGRNILGAFDWAKAQAVDPMTAGAVFAGGITTIAVLLFVGATGKSAQIPLYVWLPDAMAGPTPVSALIHAATMVTAGVYMVARSSDIFVHAPTAMAIVAIIGAATALFAATIGIAQWDIKKVLAYSTVSQLGYMLLACGAGAFTAGIFHVFTHAFFKALLFLGSGSVIIGMHHEQDMRRMGGLKKYMPWTFWTMAVGWFAIAGFPLLSGFFSKDEILYKTFTSESLGSFAKPLWAVGALTALLTAIYMTRMMVVTFFGEERYGHADHTDSHHKDDHAQDDHSHHGGKPHESPMIMVLPLAVLAAGAALAGYLGVPEGLSGKLIPNWFEHLLAPSIAHPAVAHGADAAHADHGTEIALTVVSSLIAISGLAFGYLFFRKKPLWEPPTLLKEKYYVDEAYDAALVDPIKSASTNLLWKFIDVKIIDGIVNGSARFASEMGNAMRYLQSGFARSYVAMVVLGALVIIGYFIFV